MKGEFNTGNMKKKRKRGVKSVFTKILLGYCLEKAGIGF